MFKRILVATDGSPLSKKAVDGAIAMAAQHGAELVAMTVVARYPTSYFEGSAGLASNEVMLIEQRWADEAKAELAKVTAQAQAAGVQAHVVAVNADLVAEAIITTAKEQQCDLIVMASHGRKGIQRLLLGSETQHVLTNSTLPVLVLR